MNAGLLPGKNKVTPGPNSVIQRNGHHNIPIAGYERGVDRLAVLIYLHQRRSSLYQPCECRVLVESPDTNAALIDLLRWSPPEEVEAVSALWMPCTSRILLIIKPEPHRILSIIKQHQLTYISFKLQSCLVRQFFFRLLSIVLKALQSFTKITAATTGEPDIHR